MVTITIILFILHYFRSRKVKMKREDNFTLVKEIDGYELRAYEETLRASVILKKELKKRINRGFQILFSYIDGKNNKKIKIDLVSPVSVELLEGTAKMSFVLPQKFDLESLPEPNHHRIILEKCKPKYVLCYKFGGFVSNKRLKQKKEEFKAYVKSKRFTIIGPYEYHNYNNPYTIFNRHNEIAVPILYNDHLE